MEKTSSTPCEVCSNRKRRSYKGKCLKCWAQAYEASQSTVRRLQDSNRILADNLLDLKLIIKEVKLELAGHRDTGTCSCHLKPKIEFALRPIRSTRGNPGSRE